MVWKHISNSSPKKSQRPIHDFWEQKNGTLYIKGGPMFLERPLLRDVLELPSALICVTHFEPEDESNVFAFDLDGNQKWAIEMVPFPNSKVGGVKPYVGVRLIGKHLIAYCSDGYGYKVHQDAGKITPYGVVSR